MVDDLVPAFRGSARQFGMRIHIAPHVGEGHPHALAREELVVTRGLRRIGAVVDDDRHALARGLVGGDGAQG